MERQNRALQECSINQNHSAPSMFEFSSSLPEHFLKAHAKRLRDMPERHDSRVNSSRANDIPTIRRYPLGSSKLSAFKDHIAVALRGHSKR
jgi:hypothetical protein